MIRGASHFSQDVGDVGLVERREREALLAEVLEDSAIVMPCFFGEVV